MIIAGQEWSGKSILALNLSVALAEGKDFLGFKVPAPVRVYYLNAEQSESDFMKRANIRDAAESLANPGAVGFAHRRGVLFPREGGLIRAAIAAASPQVVIIDTMSRLSCDYNENSADEMTRFFRDIEILRASPEIALVLNHHMGKNAFTREGNKIGNRELVRGSGAILAAADTIIAIEKMPSHRRLEFVKLRNYPERAPLDFFTTADYTIELGAKERVSPEAMRKMLSVVAGAEVPPQAKQLLSQCGFSRAHAYRVIHELESRKWLATSEGVFRATSLGVAYLSQSHDETNGHETNPPERKIITVNKLARKSNS